MQPSQTAGVKGEWRNGQYHCPCENGRMNSQRAGMAGFLLGSAGMFASMYSTQAILPELRRAFHVTPAAAGLLVMRRWLPDLGLPERSGGRGGGILGQLRNGLLIRIALSAGALFFTFVGVFSYVVFRLQDPPFRFGNAVSALIFLLWLL